MLRFAETLDPATYEYAIVWWGQSNARPWGSKADGFAEATHLDLDDVGLELTGIVIEAGENSGSGKVLTIGTPTLVADQVIGFELRLGSVTTPIVGVATVTANTTSTITVTWSKNGPAGPTTVAGYLVRKDMRWASYPSVRVLTPYQPDEGGSYPSGTPIMPGYTVPASITSYSDLAAFLEFSFNEGLQGYGISNVGDASASPGTAHAVTAVAATTLDFANAITAGVLYGGYIVAKSNAGTSWSAIGDNTATQLTGLSWQGAGTPTFGGGSYPLVGDIEYTAWIPHHLNSPAHYLPGAGFRYPNNDMMPAAFANSAGLNPLGRTFNRPRGWTAAAYGDRFGALLPFAFRFAAALGLPRINVIHLGINSSGQLPNNTNNEFGFQGTLGWWNDEDYITWGPGENPGNFARLTRMISPMATAALTAEANTKPLRILCIVGPQGEADALNDAGRTLYRRTLPKFYQALRKYIGDAGLSPYVTPAKIPVVHPEITEIPYMLQGTFTYYGFTVGPFDGDDEGLVNTAINEFCARDGFATTCDLNDSPKLVTDPLHFDGTGEAINGKTFADLAIPLVNKALSMSSDAAVVAICNTALGRIGDGAQITSLTAAVDGSEQARLCAIFYPKARDSLLEMHSWNFNTKRAVLVEIANVWSNTWAFAYAMPGEALRALAVQHKDATGDYGPQWSGGFWDSTGTFFPQDAPATSYVPQPFQVERDEDGNLVILTNQPEAALRYTAFVGDASLYPPLFADALSWKLAADLAGPRLKGEIGAAETKRCMQMMMAVLADAVPSDANQRQIEPKQMTPWNDLR